MQSASMTDALENDAEQGDGADTPVTSSLQSRVVGGVLLTLSSAASDGVVIKSVDARAHFFRIRILTDLVALRAFGIKRNYPNTPYPELHP